MTASLLLQVCTVQARNNQLRGAELRKAGLDVAAVATRADAGLLAVDEAGARVVGAALLADEHVRPVDASRLLDGESVVLVAGYIAGTASIQTMAALTRSLGAAHVQATVLGEAPSVIDGCDEVTRITQRAHLMAL